MPHSGHLVAHFNQKASLAPMSVFLTTYPAFFSGGRCHMNGKTDSLLLWWVSMGRSSMFSAFSSLSPNSKHTGSSFRTLPSSCRRRCSSVKVWAWTLSSSRSPGVRAPLQHSLSCGCWKIEKAEGDQYKLKANLKTMLKAEACRWKSINCDLWHGGSCLVAGLTEVSMKYLSFYVCLEKPTQLWTVLLIHITLSEIPLNDFSGSKNILQSFSKGTLRPSKVTLGDIPRRGRNMGHKSGPHLLQWILKAALKNQGSDRELSTMIGQTDWHC